MSFLGTTDSQIGQFQLFWYPKTCHFWQNGIFRNLEKSFLGTTETQNWQFLKSYYPKTCHFWKKGIFWNLEK